MLDPRQEAAKIRAFFVHPNWARQGVGRALLHICEAEAKANGFHTLELMATLPGVKLYRALGYIGSDRVVYKISDGIDIEFIPMRKTLM
jgi:GNAT superfamily N-acetyltransferase